MATFFLTIVPNLILKNNKHTVRIAVTHCRQTRYIPTDVTIDSEKEISNDRLRERNKQRKNRQKTRQGKAEHTPHEAAVSV